MKFKYNHLIFLFSFILIIYLFDDSMVYRRTKDLKIASTSSQPSSSRVSLTLSESKLFDDNFCTANEKMIKKFGALLNKKNCGNYDLGELKFALKGERTSISLFSKDSIIKEWAIQPN